MTEGIPFELAWRGNVWRARWLEEKLTVEVGGTEEAPAAALLDTLRDVVTRWPAVKETIATYVRGLASEHHVPLDPATIGGFAARSCGFDQELWYQGFSVDAPDRVEVIFYTGYPDGYATYSIILEHGVPTEVSAFAS